MMDANDPDNLDHYAQLLQKADSSTDLLEIEQWINLRISEVMLPAAASGTREAIAHARERQARLERFRENEVAEAKTRLGIV